LRRHCLLPSRLENLLREGFGIGKKRKRRRGWTIRFIGTDESLLFLEKLQPGEGKHSYNFAEGRPAKKKKPHRGGGGFSSFHTEKGAQGRRVSG